MNVDLDAIAQRGRCEVSSLRLALPLIEQGYTPPFLARYRRDELGGLDEPSLWALSHAVRTQQRLDEYREQLHSAWSATQLADPAIGRAISGAKSRRLLDRLSRRVKSESGESGSLTQRLAVRVLSPQKGDGDNLEALAGELMQAVATPTPETPKTPEAPSESDSAAPVSEDGATPEDSTESGTPSAPSAESAIAKLDDALAKRMSGDPRIMGAAVRWLSRHAKIHILEVTDPHGGSDEGDEQPAKSGKKNKKKKKGKSAEAEASKTGEAANAPEVTEPASDASVSSEPVADASASSNESEPASPTETPVADAPVADASAETPVADAVATDAPATESPAAEAVAEPASETPAVETSVAESPATESAEAPHAEEVKPEPAAATEPVAADATETPATETPAAEAPAAEAPAAEAPAAESTEPTAAEAAPATEAAAAPAATATEKKAAPAAKPAKKKKVSPRQRRRRWLVSTLKPLAGKRMPANKLSAFQIVMLSRALRSQVATCAFDYDAAQLVAEVQKAASNLNRHFSDRLAAIVLANEAALRDAAESAWWDEIQEQASARLVAIAADNLHRQINRGGVEAKVVMSIDAIGPRTAATSIVAADGRVLHNEDIPCQLSAAMRTLAVTKMGELIHQYHVDLIVISNGPARRACMIAVGELIKQSADQSVRWTLADRSGADAYAGSAAGDQEMRSTPRRFRSAAWIAFSTLQPSQAMVKVDPLKLRLGSFQRELSDQAVLDALEDVLVSGAARGGVDVNSTTASWLERLPGMTEQTAARIDTERREKLIASRDDLLARAAWASPIHTRQALPFLRVFGSEETLDGTLIHPEDYALAKRLAKALEIELPPQTPPGYELPDYSEPKPTVVETIADSGAEAGDKPAAEASADEEKAFGPSDSDDSSAEASAETETPTEASSDSESEPVAPADQTASLDAAPVTEDAPTEEKPAEEVSADSTEGEAESAAPAAESSEDAPEEQPAAETPAAPSVPEPFRQPKPERAKVDKLIKEWQVGVRRSKQIVDWLCEPFGEGTVNGPAPAVMTTMPALNELKEGDQVIGVVVGVMPFGVFVELTPECSGLIHVSRISDGFVEDLHEAVQVGDVVTAWVTGIDSKRRRVGLSAISPQREAELQARRHDSRPPRGGDRGGRGRGAAAAGARESGGAPQSRGGTAGAGPARGGQGKGQGDRSRSGGGGPRRDSRGGGGGRDGGRGRAGGGRRDQQRGGGRGPRRPEVYEVVGKEPDSAPLSDAMQEGKEPLRSFGDLMQLFNKDKPKAEKKPAEKKPADKKPEASKPAEPEAPAAEPPVAVEAPAESKPEAPSESAAATAETNPSGENA
ncbi:transcriptional accessory protein Tex/SPT6 [Rhodopirellula rubra]|uniref:Transcriptional accessory protein Tex/SPT6 n=1 Tax=Aporhodopirellula rubra TaxID=980271 RepID=A0A7W5H982_9BACT|nr:S1 RNA-binding domain-containing protein [Aporhodopirellula rubra]MBB3209845.1 transcriptional accessory protein Tex/SPT6 [Aporhodopirellula rubra]